TCAEAGWESAQARTATSARPSSSMVNHAETGLTGRLAGIVTSINGAPKARRQRSLPARKCQLEDRQRVAKRAYGPRRRSRIATEAKPSGIKPLFAWKSRTAARVLAPSR